MFVQIPVIQHLILFVKTMVLLHKIWNWWNQVRADRKGELPPCEGIETYSPFHRPSGHSAQVLGPRRDNYVWLLASMCLSLCMDLKCVFFIFRRQQVCEKLSNLISGHHGGLNSHIHIYISQVHQVSKWKWKNQKDTFNYF